MQTAGAGAGAPKPLYFDYAATAPVRDEVAQAMRPYFSAKFGNPSSLYELASEARDALETAREQVAGALNARPRDIAFTSGGTEANNAAVKGAALANRQFGKHIIVSAIEHPSVREAAEQLVSWGYEADIVGVDRDGRIKLDELENALRADTTLVSAMYVNNELGTIQDLPAIARLLAAKTRDFKHKVVLHADAIQAAGKLPLDIKALSVDILTLSGHKIGAPKGVGAIYVKRGAPFEPLIVGGGQERQRRSGTENVPSIVAMGVALELADAERERFNSRAAELRAALLDGLRRLCPDLIVNSPADAAPSIVNVSFPDITGETMLIALDFEGVCASSGSACSSASLEPSAVLRAIGLGDELAVCSIRFSFGRDATAADISELLVRAERALKKVRELT